MGALHLGFGLFEIAALAFGLTFWAVLFWGSVKIVDAENSHNKFGSAMAWSGVHLLLAFVLGWSNVFGLIIYAAWLVFMLRLLVDFYGIGLLKSLLAVIISNAAPFALAPLFTRVILTSGEGGAMVILFGFPIVTFVVWLGPGMQQRRRTAAEQPGIPVARLFRRRSKVTAEPVAAAPARPSAPAVRRPGTGSGSQPALRPSSPAIRPSGSRPSGSQPVAPPAIAAPPASPPAAIAAAVVPPPIPVARPVAAVPPPIAAPSIAPGATPVVRAQPGQPPAPLVVPAVSPAPATPRATTDAAHGPVGEPTFLR